MKFYPTILEEQESNINIDYYGHRTIIYSSRKKQIETLTKELGEPKETYYTKGKISGASWEIPFNDRKRTSKALSRRILIGQMKSI